MDFNCNLNNNTFFCLELIGSLIGGLIGGLIQLIFELQCLQYLIFIIRIPRDLFVILNWSILQCNQT